MKLYYTNSLEPKEEQVFAERSIGGYVSSSQVPNDFLNNLFSDASSFAIQSNKRETYLLALENTSGKLVEEVKLKFTLSSDTIITMKLATVAPTKDACSNLVFEKIPNSSSLPYSATFVDIVNGTEINVGSIVDKSALGFWFSKTFDKTKVKPKTCVELETDFDNGVEKILEETISIDISWVEDDSISLSDSSS